MPSAVGPVEVPAAGLSEARWAVPSAVGARSAAVEPVGAVAEKLAAGVEVACTAAGCTAEDIRLQSAAPGQTRFAAKPELQEN